LKWLQSPRLATVGRSGDLLCSQFMVVPDVAIVNVALSQMRASLGLSIASKQ
jgi:hypothetical protein